MWTVCHLGQGCGKAAARDSDETLGGEVFRLNPTVP